MIPFDPTLARRLAAGSPRVVRDSAFRIRAGLQGMLGSCLCAWPLVRHATSSEHAPECPAQAIYSSMLAAEGGEVSGRQDKRDRKALGICQSCDNIVVPGKSRCIKHLEAMRRNAEKKRWPLGKGER